MGLGDRLILALAVLFAASGTVPIYDLSCPILVTSAVLLLIKHVFPAVAPGQAPPQKLYKGRLFFVYITTGGVVGLLLPLVYILGGVAAGRGEDIKAAGAHTFLLLCQVYSEKLCHMQQGVTLPVHALVATMYNAWRLAPLYRWLVQAWGQPGVAKADFGAAWGGGFGTEGNELWQSFGKGLAAANVLFWCYNLFCFLLPEYLPRSLWTYRELGSKQAEKVE